MRGADALHGRSVLLRGGGEPLVLARSAALAAAVCGPWRALRALGSRSLGELLFASLPLRRSALQWQWLPAATPEARALRRDWALADALSAPRGGVWRRWSVFQRQGCALWVAEYFTPQVLAGLPPPGRGLAAQSRARAAGARVPLAPQRRRRVRATGEKAQDRGR